MENQGNAIIKCPNCNLGLRIPNTNSTLLVKCPLCSKQFYYPAKYDEIPTFKIKWKNIYRKHRIKYLLALIILISLSFIFFESTKSNWIVIPYGQLVEKATLTHSGETVENVISKIPRYDDSIKGLVQPYLEPFSKLCHDKLVSVIGVDTPPLVSILTHYPIGSEQPAWVALSREGHFQIYYNKKLIRIFLKGTNPEVSFEKYRSVIRHPIRDIINSKYMDIENIEVYVFNNNYASTEIRLNTIPAVYSINNINLSPKHKSIDLDSIEEFLNFGVVLEAVEIDRNNNLFFYGKRDSNQTMAGQPLSLADIAVVYRSIFHYGYNAPYISLDNHEDNRYAKVNFGGHLQNTRIGHVVLEADKLFKTLSTGFDPNTHEQRKLEISKFVPEFLIEDERRFLEGFTEEHLQIRYWFYPDDIGTVSDGTIAAIKKWQFLADAERMDIKGTEDRAVRETIDHLNTNFAQYEKADNTYKELSTAGRIMALVNWLRERNMGERVELDELLSVKIPAFSTPEKTNKLLAVTAIDYPANLSINRRNVRNYSKTYNLSHLIGKYPPSTSDSRFLNIAGERFAEIDTSYLYPPYNKLKSEIAHYKKLINSKKIEINLLEKDIERRRLTLDRYSSKDVSQYNQLIDRFNRLLREQENLISIYNLKVNEFNDMQIRSRQFTSIGGGISLNPKDFKQIEWNKNSPILLNIVRIKGQLQPFGNVARSGDWIRSNAGSGGARINVLPYVAGLH